MSVKKKPIGVAGFVPDTYLNPVVHYIPIVSSASNWQIKNNQWRSQEVKKYLQQLSGVLFMTAAISQPAQAELDYKYTFNGQWVQSYSNNASIYLEISGNGVNRTVNLNAQSGNYSTGDKVVWIGPIPPDAVKVEGIHNVSVYVNTCEHEATHSTGCGIVNVTATSLPGWENFRVLTQVSHFHTWDGLIFHRVGHIHDRFTNTTGSVNGYPINIDNSGDIKTWMSRMGTAKDMQISVITQ